MLKHTIMKHTLQKLIFILIGILISILVPFFGIKCSIFFLIGFLLGVQLYKTVIKVKQEGDGNLYILTFKHLLFALIQMTLSLLGFLLGVGIIRLIM